jgi:excisionase family DNA binding protein
MKKNAANEWISVPEAAQLKGVAESSVRVAIQTGRLTGAKVGRSYIVRRQDVETWRPGPRGPKRARSGEAQKQSSWSLAAPDTLATSGARSSLSPGPTREEILAFLQADPHEQERLLRQTGRPDVESPFQKAARLKAAASQFAHRGVSTEDYFREKRAEIELELMRADARDA